MKHFVLNKFMHFFLALIVCASVSPARAEGPEDGSGPVEVIVVDDSETVADADKKKKEKEEKGKDKSPPRSSFGYVNFGGALNYDTPNDTTGGIGAGVGYYYRGTSIKGNVTGITKDYATFGFDAHRAGYSLVCDYEKKDEWMCIRLDANVAGQIGVGTKNGTITARGFASPAFKLNLGDHTVLTAGAGIAGGGLYSSRFSADGSGKGVGGVGANGFLFLDSRYFNASLSGDYIWSLDPSNPIEGVGNVGGLVSVPVFKKKEADGKTSMSIDLYVDGKVDIAKVSADASTKDAGAFPVGSATTRPAFTGTGGLQVAF